MSVMSEVTQQKWERRLRSFWIVGGTLFIAGILAARPLTESFETMRWFIPLAIISLFSALAMSGVAWLLLQIALSHRDRDQRIRSRTASFR
ncbi:MAG: hypothetical protein AMXMBFR74_09610 [Parvibaculum sp.]|jgi:hypothetical protein|uniref:hypothetical protein n=1 Tax=Parvibaculum sp. TaxID=2024848 RepID=UPI0035BAEF0C